MSPPNYAAEADVRAACDRAGVLETAQADFIDEFRAGYFDRNGIEAWIEKRRTERPQRWVIGGTENNDLYVRAFGPEPNKTAAGEVVKLVGESRAAEIAAQFQTTLGSTKPGKVPEGFKTKNNGGDHTTNPWLRLRNADGTVNKNVEADIGRLVTALGRKKCEAMAAAVNKTISGLPLKAS